MASGNYNYALNKSVAASSYILPYVPERAVNGTLSGPADRWTSAFWKFEDEKLFYKVDFGASYSISRYVIKSICDLPTGSSDKWPDNYENISVAVVYSTDNENWVDLDEYTSIENTIDRQFNSVKARYFMLTFPRGMVVNQNFVSIAQLEVYNTASQYLKSLTLSAGTLSPSFSGTTQFNYTTVVEESVTRISLTPTAFSPSAIIQVNGQTVPSGTVSNSIPLSSDGHTAITVEVSDAGMSQLYTVLVSKNFSNSYIRSLTVNENDKNKSEVTLNPYFDGRYYFNYTASVEYDALNSGSDTTQVTVTPTAEASNATIRVNNMLVPSGSSSSNIPLTIGAGNIIQVSCVSGQNALQMYTIAVTKASSPYLSGVTNMPINEPFKNTTLNYTATTSASSINVTPISEDPTAAITVKSGSTTQPVLSGKPVKLTFTSGQNIVTISISSTIGIDSRTYTFTVNKI